jgi:hypothetical protein
MVATAVASKPFAGICIRIPSFAIFVGTWICVEANKTDPLVEHLRCVVRIADAAMPRLLNHRRRAQNLELRIVGRLA